MAHKKSKYEIIDKMIIQEGLAESNWWYWYDYDDDYHHDEFCSCYFCEIDYNYTYLPDDVQPEPVKYIDSRFRKMKTLSMGKLIDMSSVYSKEVYRQKKINHILGIELIENYKPTLGDIWNFKK